MAAAPLNVQNIRGHLQEIANELQQAPPLQQQTQQQLGAIQDQIAAVQGQISNLKEQLDDAVIRIQTRLDRLPSQLYNAAASLDTPLIYPPDVDRVDPLPLLKTHLLTMSGEDCHEACQLLGIHLPPGATVLYMRQQVMDFFGAGLRAEMSYT